MTLGSRPARRHTVWAVLACVSAASGMAQQGEIPPPPGTLVDIGGRRLHLYCTGSGPGTLIVENGGGAFSFDWVLVQPEVSKFARICTYDRSGYAWSDPGPAPDMVGQIVDDLHLLLRTARLRPPYVLVGASIGGFYARAFQRRYPDEVSGMVMVDSTTEESSAWIVDGKPKVTYLVSREEMNALMKKYLESAGSSSQPQPAALEAPFNRLPKEEQSLRDWAAAKYASQADRHFQPAASEATREEFIAQRALRLSSESPLGRLPLIVLIRGRENDEAVRRRGEELARLSSIGRLIVADNSGHEIHLWRPDLVIQAIRDVTALSVKKQ
jgi:pimeloyl-ACP methyl ester carboxylesterase